MNELSEEVIMNLDSSDFRDLTDQEKLQDNFRRMFQMLGIIYKNQIELKEILTANKNI